MNAELSCEEWQTIRASVEREYRRAYRRAVKGKELADSSHEHWKVLIKKINAHLEMSAKGWQECES